MNRERKQHPKTAELDLRLTYVALIKNSVGSKMFRNLYLRNNGKRRDILRRGELSCAFYVSVVLHLFNLIRGPHPTVNSTIKDMDESEWIKINIPRIGCVLVWEEERSENGEAHRHIGFYVGNHRAISNSERTATPVVHHWTFGVERQKPVRKIIAIYWNEKLDGRNN